MKETIALSDTAARWSLVQANPLYWPGALTDEEGAKIHWHSPSSMRSSQVLCASALGGVRSLPDGDGILITLFREALPGVRLAGPWQLAFEYSNAATLGETGQGTPTTVDVFAQSDSTVICIEGKFLADAAEGFGSCSQVSQGDCAGFYGPGSDLKELDARVPCRLAVQDGQRAPRYYWQLARDYFQPSIFQHQSRGQECPFAGPAFQLMRNFLLAAREAWPQREFGLIAIVPDRTSAKLREQLATFRNLLLPAFQPRVGIATYDQMFSLLAGSPHERSRELGAFLSGNLSGNGRKPHSPKPGHQ